MLHARFCWFLLALLTVVLVAVLMLMASVPPVSRDALIHHLAIPKLIIEGKGWIPLPDMVFSWYPSNLEVLYSIALFLGNDILANFIHLGFALACSALIYLWISQESKPLHGLIGALFFLSLPVVVQISPIAYVDMGLVFFSTAALYFITQWNHNVSKKSRLIWAAIFCGLAMGTKYNGFICLFLLMTYLFMRIGKKNGFSIALKYCALFVFLSIFISSPWWIRNYFYTGNPVYPLFDSVISPGPPDPTGSIQAKVPPFLIRKLVYHESLLQIIAVPLRIFFQGEEGNPALFDGRLNPLLFFLPLIALFIIKRDNILWHENLFLFYFAWGYIIFAFLLTDMRVRYIAPSIPPLIILSVRGIIALENLWKKISSKLNKVSLVSMMQKGICTVAVGLFLGLNSGYIIAKWNSLKPLSYLTGAISRDEYISKFLHEYPVIKFANQRVAKNDKILCLFCGNRRYYFQPDCLFSRDLLWKLAKLYGSADAIRAHLLKMKITHLMVNDNLFWYWTDRNLDANHIKILMNFFNYHTSKLFSSGGYSLYIITSDHGRISQEDTG